ncbi:uncharacterized protein LOC132356574 [Balaenoptera ricei]|uniref:uncharacterized protein LOC132356574 n=1 Tax=Balaenoptera ricei TaxID=2746895 RepID=UPI0028BE3D57|nr:uncharacterized protein LOC132356574 [Balaenoptera ricei]
MVPGELIRGDGLSGSWQKVSLSSDSYVAPEGCIGHFSCIFLIRKCEREGQDGGRVRRGDHLPSHRYSRNTSTRGTGPTEHPLNAGRRRQTSQKRARRGDSERRLNELQRRGRAAAISVDPRGGHEPRLTARTPETGASRGYQRRPQRRAGDAKAAAAATKKPVCEHRSLSTPPLLGACAACHCQGPVIQGQLRRENARRASGCCNVTPASAATGSSCIRAAPSPRPE